MIPVVPLPQYGYKIGITSLPETWNRLADQSAWDSAVTKLLDRIGIICQTHIQNIMRGNEPNKDGNIVPFLNPTGRGVQAIKFAVDNRSVEIYAY